MRIVFFVINYKADFYLRKFVKSINLAKKEIDLEIDIHVIDNSQKNKNELNAFENEYKNSNVRIHSNGDNVGYFGGIPIAQKILQTFETDCVIYCNPDLRVDVHFFNELLKSKDNVGIIAPAILSEGEGVDQNPKYTRRLSLTKMKRLKYIYSNLFTHTIFFTLARIKELMDGKRNNKVVSIMNENIYAPHGAMFIFNDLDFFKNLKSFPCFLFGEEIFIAEEAIKNNTLIYYKPSIKVYDVRHASISLLSNKFKRDLYYKSIDYLLKSYY